jgi:hypothetical protein
MFTAKRASWESVARFTDRWWQKIGG